MPDVFLSYARSDSKEFVRRLADALQATGLDVWVDLDDIPAASDWQQDLRDGILQSDCFCFVISPKSAASTYCLGELSDAESHNKRVIPAIHLEVDDNELPKALRRLNWVPQLGEFNDDFDKNVATLVEAIQTDLEATKAHTRWERDAAAWMAKNRDRSLLPRGSELREAETWITTQTGRDPAPTALQAEFVEAARRASERRRRIIFGATVGALAISIALGVVAVLQRNEARVQRDNARSNELASAAQANLANDPELSIILAKEAVETVDTPRSQQALAQAISQSLLRMTLNDPGKNSVEAAGYSPDGKLIATASAGGVELWDAETGEAVRTITSTPANDVDFTSDSSRIAAAGPGGALAIYGVEDGSEKATFDAGNGELYSVDISPDDKLVAAAGTGAFAASFDIETGDSVVFDGHAGEFEYGVNAISYSANSQVVLTAADDGTARLWFADDASELAVLSSKADEAIQGIAASRPGAPTADAEFSPDGNAIATANVDGTISLWSLEGAKPKPSPLIVDGDVFAVNVTFNERRNAIIAGGIERADAIDLDTGRIVASYRGQNGFVNQVQINDDGSQLVTAAEDGTAQVWDFNPVRFFGDLPVSPFDIDFSGDGTRLVTGGFPAVVDVAAETAKEIPFGRLGVPQLAWDPSADRVALADTNGDVRIVDPATGEPAGAEIDPPGDQVTEVELSADGARVMATTLTNGVAVYDTESGEELTSVPGIILASALSPDGASVAFYGSPTRDDRRVDIVDVDSGDTVGSLLGHTAAISSIDYSGDGSRIVTGSDDASSRIWDASTGEQVLPRLNNRGVAIRHVAFSPDGNFVASIGDDIAIWSAETGRELMRVPGFRYRVDLSPDGKLIAAIGPGDKTVSFIDCDICVDDADELLALADERITREPTAAERIEYLER